MPQILAFLYRFPFKEKKDERTTWDYNALGQCLQKANNKEAFLADLEAVFQQKNNQ